jgi:hypothetical protein
VSADGHVAVIQTPAFRDADDDGTCCTHTIDLVAGQRLTDPFCAEPPVATCAETLP